MWKCEAQTASRPFQGTPGKRAGRLYGWQVYRARSHAFPLSESEHNQELIWGSACLLHASKPEHISTVLSGSRQGCHARGMILASSPLLDKHGGGKLLILCCWRGLLATGKICGMCHAEVGQDCNVEGDFSRNWDRLLTLHQSIDQDL